MKVEGSRLGAFVRFSLFGLLSMTILAAGVRAQIGTQGTFVGSVKDSSGAIVAGATVTATNIATGESQSTPTNQDGLYRIPQLPPGHYRLQSTQTGFRAEVHSDIELTVGQTQEVDFTLQVGANTETVTVTGEAPLVDTSTSTVSSLVNEQQVQNLPLNGRDYSQLLYLTPGVPNVSGASSPTRANPQFAIGGARPTTTRLMMDGTEVVGSGNSSNSLPNSASQKLLGVDALAEFSVSSNSGDATIGKEEGGQVNLVTRSGTNDFHGSAYEFFRSNVFDADSYFATSTPRLTRNNYGASIGGPVKKNKTFFFFNFEQYRDREDVTESPFLPDPNARKDIIEGVSAAGACTLTTMNPVTGVQTNPNGTTQNFNPVQTAASFAVMQFYPNLPGTLFTVKTSTGNVCPEGIQQSSLETPSIINDNFYIGRIDQQISQKQSIFARYLIQEGPRVTPLNDPFDQFPVNNPFRMQLFTLGHRYAFSSGLLNQFSASFGREWYQILVTTDPGVNPSTIPAGLFLNPGASGVTGVGTLEVGSIGTTNSSPAIYHAINYSATGSEFHRVARQVWEGDDQLSKNVGQHFLQWGVQYQRIFSDDNLGSAYDGTLLFQTLLGFVEGQPTTYSGASPVHNNGQRSWRQNYTGLYAQDSYRFKPNLTFNFGLRWEYLTNPTESHNLITQWFPVLGGDGACAATVVCYPTINVSTASSSEPGLVYPLSNVFTSNNSGNWAPRVGFAWNVFGSGKTSLRGGFGMFYNQLQNEYRPPEGAAPPFFLSVNVTNPPWPVPGTSAASGTTPAIAPNTIQPNPKIPTMNQYNLTLQQEVAPNTVLSLGYVGNEAYHQSRDVNPQMPIPVLNSAGQFVVPSQKQLNPNLSGSATEIIFDANASYNALQATLEKRLSRGLQFKAVFAWAKTLDESTDISSAGTLGFGTVAAIITDKAYDKGPAPFGVTRNFTLNWLYDLPLGTHEKAMGQLLNGWQLGGIYHQQTGLPFSVLAGFADEFSASNASSGYSRASWSITPAGPAILGGHGPGHPYYNPGDFVVPAAGVLGNTIPGALTGPGLATVDVSLMKYFNLTERFRLQFRADAFNFLNHPNFGLPSIQLNTNATTPSATAGIINTVVGDPREGQFALRLIF